ncbi:MAG: cysteine synthase A [Polyangiaceae bacterium]
MLLSSVTEVIGGTPLIALKRLSSQAGVQLLAKLEGVNPAGSVKDRVARSMVDDAETRGLLKPGATLIEPTSGNTGIALAMIAAARGYRLILTMPEAMSRERVQLLKAYGAEVVLTPGTLMRSAVEQACMLQQTTPGSLMLGQFENSANPLAHELTTAEEILTDCDGKLDFFVAGIGTGGTITGVGRVLKRRGSAARVVGVEPDGAAVLSGQTAQGHHLQGIGPGFVPKVLDRSVIDELHVVTERDALDAARRLAREEGILAGISSGAALAVALRLARQHGGKTLVVVLPDGGERYASTALFEALAL